MWTQHKLVIVVFSIVLVSPSIAQGQTPLVWSSVSPMPDESSQALTVDGRDGYVYIFGGFRGGSATKNTYIYDIAGDTYLKGAAMPQRRRGHCGDILPDGRILVVGGYQGSSQIHEADVYDPATDSWSPAGLHPSGWRCAAATDLSGKVHVFGGESSRNGHGIYDYVTNTWSTGKVMPIARYSHGAALGSDSKIYVFGGCSSYLVCNVTDSSMTTTSIYDPSTNSWTGGPNLPARNSNFSVASIGNFIYLFGGTNTYVNDTPPYYDHVWYLDIAGGSWFVDGSTLPSPRRESAGTYAGGNFYVFGGSDGSPRDDVFVSVRDVDIDGDGYTNSVDCNDFDASIHPGATEVCDGVDNNCDRTIDEGLSIDSDGDGHYTPGSCAAPDDDCDDTDFSINPGAPEVCDGVDNNCDGSIDEGLDLDLDGDGHYAPGSCAAPDDDCDDTDFSIHPEAPEVCDGVDNNCDGSIDEGLSIDSDGDGHFAPGSCAAPDDDCDDTNLSIHPGATEVCDGVDNNCDGSIDEGLDLDLDGDGHYAPGSCTGPDDDCNDTDISIHPGAIEVCDGVDNNCNGSIDEGLSIDSDGDGHFAPGSCTGPDDDCDDTDISIHPSATEICDAVDNNCNGSIDEGLSIDSDGDGHFSPGSCTGPDDDCDDSAGSVYPGASETCDGLDNNCDGSIDEGLSTDSDGDGHYTPDSCSAPSDDCNDAEPDIYGGAPELCDRLDNDCDGTIPPDELDVDGDGQTPCEGDCNDMDSTVGLGFDELCDGIDNDCNGVIPSVELDLDSDGQPECAGDCDDDDPTTGLGFPEICDGIDNDCDGDILGETRDNDSDGYTPCAGDCDDSDETVYLGAPELCDGIDNDCDGELSPEEVDEDDDGQMLCEGDCDDLDDTVGLGFPELCDGIDNDCDGELLGETEDNDGDGLTPCEGDCNDLEPTVYPEAPELCDGLDNNCDDILPDDEVDEDHDGYEVCADDCDDLNETVFPDAEEICDGLDNDCDNVIPDDELDFDEDGYSICAGDCNDEDAEIYPGAVEVCNGLDDDCDGIVPQEELDGDGDGQSPCEGDCDDLDPDVYLGAEEIDNGIDNNCDETIPAEVQDFGVASFACDCSGAVGKLSFNFRNLFFLVSGI